MIGRECTKIPDRKRSNEKIKQIQEEKKLNQTNKEFSRKYGQTTPSQGVGAQRAQSQRQTSDAASPNSSVSKPLPVVLLKQLSNQKTSETSRRK